MRLVRQAVGKQYNIYFISVLISALIRKTLHGIEIFIGGFLLFFTYCNYKAFGCVFCSVKFHEHFCSVGICRIIFSAVAVKHFISGLYMICVYKSRFRIDHKAQRIHTAACAAAV